MIDIVVDVILLCGIAGLIAGCWRLSTELGLIVGGAVLIGVSLWIAYKRQRT